MSMTPKLGVSSGLHRTRRNSHPVGTNVSFSPVELVDQSFVSPSLGSVIVTGLNQHRPMAARLALSARHTVPALGDVSSSRHHPINVTPVLDIDDWKRS
jgi:hypothetical protein